MTRTNEPDKGSLVVDHYRIIVTEDEGLGEQRPKTWREVGTQVNGHMMRLVAGTTRLLAEVIESTTRLVRGLSGLPLSVSRRLEQSHSRADLAEGKEQDRLLSTGLPSFENGLNVINEILQKYRALGYVAEIRIATDGRPVIVILPEETRDAIRELKDQNSSDDV